MDIDLKSIIEESDSARIIVLETDLVSKTVTIKLRIIRSEKVTEFIIIASNVYYVFDNGAIYCKLKTFGVGDVGSAIWAALYDYKELDLHSMIQVNLVGQPTEEKNIGLMIACDSYQIIEEK